jgi:hypothetical protein
VTRTTTFNFSPLPCNNQGDVDVTTKKYLRALQDATFASTLCRRELHGEETDAQKGTLQAAVRALDDAKRKHLDTFELRATFAPEPSKTLILASEKRMDIVFDKTKICVGDVVLVNTEPNADGQTWGLAVALHPELKTHAHPKGTVAAVCKNDFGEGDEASHCLLLVARPAQNDHLLADAMCQRSNQHACLI